MRGLDPPELDRYVQQKVASGEFESETAFFREAAHLYRHLEQRHAQLSADVAHAVDQLSRGEGIELKGDAELRAFFDDIKARGRKRARGGQDGV